MKEAEEAQLARERMHEPATPIMGASYRDVLALAKARGFRGLLVWHNNVTDMATAREVFAALEPWTVAKRQGNKWPGTTTAEAEGCTLVEFELTDGSVEVLHRVDGFASWDRPLPEDLAILRPDGSTWLGTIAHEGDVWFEVTPAEKEELERSIPAVAPLRKTHA
jgi:hypothetical protein